MSISQRQPGSSAAWRTVAVLLLVISGALAPAGAAEPDCVFSEGERLAALESLAAPLRDYVESGGLYPANLQQLPPGVLDELPPPVAADSAWLWPPAATAQGGDDRLMQGNYVSSSCVAAVDQCGTPVTSVCYVLIDGAGSFCSETSLLLAEAGCDASTESPGL